MKDKIVKPGKYGLTWKVPKEWEHYGIERMEAAYTPRFPTYEEQILAYMRTSTECTAREIQEKTGIAQATVWCNLKQMMNRELVTRQKSLRSNAFLYKLTLKGLHLACKFADYEPATTAVERAQWVKLKAEPDGPSVFLKALEEIG